MANWFELHEDDDRAVAGFMARVASLPTTDATGNPMALWWKAQLIRRWDAERRAQLPLDVMDRIEIGAGLAAVAGLLVWAIPTVSRLLAAPFRVLLG